MPSRLPFQQITRCPSCSLKLLNSFAKSRVPQSFGISPKPPRRAFSISTQKRDKEESAIAKKSRDGKGLVWKNLDYVEKTLVKGALWGDLNYITDLSRSNVLRGAVWGDLRFVNEESTRIVCWNLSYVNEEPTNTIWGNLNYANKELAHTIKGNLNYDNEEPTHKIWGNLNYGNEESAHMIWGSLNYIVVPTPGNSEGITEAAVPWYLQSKYTAINSFLIPERAPLPPLPDNPPDVLEPMLKYMDTDLGITDLKILDLRPLDPAPALGPDIIMVFGTARSVKHLMTSGDKVCRWLRSTYHIHPYADGLVSRSKRQRINSRRIRRGNVAASQLGEESELTQTEWVCVNVGYGGLIAQLFTERRREELKLEALWNRKLDTNRKNKEKMAQAAAEGRILTEKDLIYDEDSELSEVVHEGPLLELQEGTATDNPLGDSPTPGYPVFPVGSISSFPKTQFRAFHTFRTLGSQSTLIPRKSRDSPSISNMKLPKSFQELMEHVPAELAAEIMNGSYSNLSRLFSKFYSGHRYSRTIEQASILYAHVYFLQHCSPEVASEALGTHAFDTMSTPFLRSFFQEIPPVPQLIHYHAWLSLIIQGHILKPEAYTVSSFRQFITQMRASGVNVPITFVNSLLEVMASTPELRKQQTSTTLRLQDSTQRMEEMMKLLEDMSRSLGYDINTPETYTVLVRGLLTNDVDGYRKMALDVCEVPGFARKVRNMLQDPRRKHAPDRRIFWLDELMNKFGVKQTLPDYYINFLIGSAMSGYWIALWNRWKDIQYQGLSRGKELYKLVLGLISMSGNENEALNALRILQDSMSTEESSIELDVELARGFLAVMEVAGGRRGRNGVGVEYAPLRSECENLLYERGELLYHWTQD
ncbi:hypothetical protein BDZ91DRAFT_708970 [Kalaharituber pfeilii]|nr:hypothetical protein BDZ91DRAFT_708970 [Kalaharituber pfeilii]